MTTPRPAHAPRHVTLDPVRLGSWLAPAIGAQAVTVESAALLGGGSVQENWRIEVSVEGGPCAGRHVWVLRTDAMTRLAVSLDRAGEHAVLAAAHAAGVRVAEPLARCTDTSVIGRSFLVQAFVPGTAQARRITRDPGLAAFGPRLAAELGTELARIHAIRPPRPDLALLPIPIAAPARAEIARLRSALDGASEPRPALEYVLAWLDREAPAERQLALVHGDFRTGNYLVADRRLAAILDWEFAHWGDPREDLAWFTARCWRFGNDPLEAGGIAPRAAFLDAYNAAASRSVTAAELAYWEVLAAARWAAIAVLQGDRYRTGGETVIEMALTGLMASELELEALDGLRAIEAGKRGR